MGLQISPSLFLAAVLRDVDLVIRPLASLMSCSPSKPPTMPSGISSGPTPPPPSRTSLLWFQPRRSGLSGRNRPQIWQPSATRWAVKMRRIHIQEKSWSIEAEMGIFQSLHTTCSVALEMAGIPPCSHQNIGVSPRQSSWKVTIKNSFRSLMVPVALLGDILKPPVKVLQLELLCLLWSGRFNCPVVCRFISSIFTEQGQRPPH